MTMLRALLRRGDLTRDEIAKKLGCTLDVLRARMREAGLVMPPRRRPSVCPRGHDLTVVDALSANNQCLACKRLDATRWRNKQRQHNTWISIDLGRVVALRDQGKNLRQISKLLGVAYGTLTKRTARAGIKFTQGMTKERWAARRERCAESAMLRPRDSDVEQARQAALQAEYLAAVVEEETLPHWQRGRAAQLRAAMESKTG